MKIRDLFLGDVIIFIIVGIPVLVSLILLTFTQMELVKSWIIYFPQEKKEEDKKKKRKTKESHKEKALTYLCGSLAMMLFASFLSLVMGAYSVLSLFSIWFIFMTLLIVDATSGRNMVYASQKVEKRVRRLTTFSTLISIILFSLGLKF